MRALKDKSKVAALRPLFTLIVVIVIAIIFLYLTHNFDNKYTYPGAVGAAGVLDLSQGLGSKEMLFLTDDWEFYQYRLLSPKDFRDESKGILPDAYVDIGQYPGFELKSSDNPHGSATYRLRILTDSKKMRYKLELPEIFSAYKLWINGDLISEAGETDPNNYRPEIVHRTVEFEGNSEIEIILATTDFTHYYSGLYYPPAFGTPLAIDKMLFSKLIIKGVQCFFTLAMGLAYFIIAINNKNKKEYRYMYLLCLFFLGYSSYALIHIFGVRGNFFWYRLEDFCFNGVLWTVVMLQWEICRFNDGLHFFNSKYWRKILMAVGILAMVISFVVPQFFIQGNLSNMIFYSKFMSIYRWCIFAYLIFTVTMALYEKRLSSLSMLCGLMFFIICILGDSLDYWYEPIILGWGTETGGFFVVCTMGGMVLYRYIELNRINIKLMTEQEQIKEISADIAHDLKAPLTAINSYAELLQDGIAREMGVEDEYLKGIQNKSQDLRIRIEGLQRLSTSLSQEISISSVESSKFLQEVVDKHKDLAKNKGVALYFEGENFLIQIDRGKMNLALENLIMNALRYTHKGGSIKLAIKKVEKNIIISVSDTGEGMDPELTDQIFHRYFTKDQSHVGLGLSIVSKVINIHRGEIELHSVKGEGSTFTIKLPLN